MNTVQPKSLNNTLCGIRRRAAPCCPSLLRRQPPSASSDAARARQRPAERGVTLAGGAANAGRGRATGLCLAASFHQHLPRLMVRGGGRRRGVTLAVGAANAGRG